MLTIQKRKSITSKVVLRFLAMGYKQNLLNEDITSSKYVSNIILIRDVDLTNIPRLPLCVHHTNLYKFQRAHLSPVCPYGKFGKKCLQNCSSNCGGTNKLCHHIDGHCTDGCVSGFQGDQCEESKQLFLLTNFNFRF